MRIAVSGTEETAVGRAAAVAGGRLLHLETLRILAIALVLFNHTGSDGFVLFGTTHNPVAYVVFLFFSILCKIAVPLFFMISGALLIPKDEDLKTVYRKRVLRLAVALVLFSLAWYGYNLITDGGSFDIRFFVRAIVTSTSIHGSYWYLYSYLAVLLMLPFIRRMARAMTFNEFVYLFVLQIVFVALFPIAQYAAGLKKPVFVEIPLVAVNLFFFVAGYFIQHRAPEILESKRWLWSAVGVSLLCIVITGVITSIRLWRTGDTSMDGLQVFHNYLIAPPTITAFLLLKRAFRGVTVPPGWAKLIVWVGGTVFGVYLIEGMLRDRLRFILADLTPSLTTFPSCILWILASLVASVVIVSVLKLVPGLKKIL